MKTGFYIKFKADSFNPGVYTFRGVWRPTNDESTITITFHDP